MSSRVSTSPTIRCCRAGFFSYIDTQLRRVGPNFHELPINRSLRPVDNNQRDGFGRITINPGKVSYFPNSLGGGCPMHSPAAAAAFRSVAVQEAGAKLRQRSDSFNDHFSQATLFWNSMSDWEKDHIAAAFSFELNMVVDQGVRNRVMNELLCNVSPELADMVSAQTGIDVAPAGTPAAPTPSAPTPSGPLNPKAAELRSPALSMDKAPPLVRGRKIAILVGDGVDSAIVKTIVGDLTKAGQVPELIGPTGGAVIDAGTKPLPVNRAAPNAPSVIYDAVLIPPGVAAGLATMPVAQRFIDEAFRHGKPIAAAEDARALLGKLGLEGGEGVVIGDGKLATLLLDNLAQHRFPRRVSNLAPN